MKEKLQLLEGIVTDSSPRETYIDVLCGKEIYRLPFNTWSRGVYDPDKSRIYYYDKSTGKILQTVMVKLSRLLRRKIAFSGLIKTSEDISVNFFVYKVHKVIVYVDSLESR